jgi:hypothetical protein
MNSWPTSLRLPFPGQLDALAMPANQSLGFDDDQGIFPMEGETRDMRENRAQSFNRLGWTCLSS